MLKEALKISAGVVFANQKVLTGKSGGYRAPDLLGPPLLLHPLAPAHLSVVPSPGPQADFDLFTAPNNYGRCKFESSVGAGTSFVTHTQRVVAAGDAVKSIQGLCGWDEAGDMMLQSFLA